MTLKDWLRTTKCWHLDSVDCTHQNDYVLLRPEGHPWVLRQCNNYQRAEATFWYKLTYNQFRLFNSTTLDVLMIRSERLHIYCVRKMRPRHLSVKQLRPNDIILYVF